MSDLKNIQVPTGSLFVLDTNILIELADPTREHHRVTFNGIRRLKEQRAVRLVYFLASKLEFLEYTRKRAMTLYLRGIVRSDSDYFGGSGALSQKLQSLSKLSADAPADEVLSDKEIKELRTACLLNSGDPSRGFTQWKNLCKFALPKDFARAAENLKKLDIHYSNLQDKTLFPDGRVPKWERQEELMQLFALSSADAAIVNMAECAKGIFGLISNDRDMIELFKSGAVATTISCYTFISHLAAA